MFSAEYIRQRISKGEHTYMAIHTYDRRMTIDAGKGDARVLTQLFDDFEQNCVSGKYIIELYTEENTKAGKKNDLESRKVLPYTKEANVGGISGPSTMDKYYKDSIELRTQIAEMKFNKQLEEIEARSSSRTFDMLEKIFFHLTMNGGAQPAQPMAGPAKQPATPDETDAFAAKLAEWNENDPDVQETVEALAKMAKNNREQYLQYRSFLVGDKKPETKPDAK